MFAFFGPLLSALAGWLFRAFGVAVGTTLIASLGMMFSDVILGLISQVVGIGVHAVESTGVSMPTPLESFAALPPEMLAIMKRIRLDDALGIIVAAVGVRGVASMFGAIRGLRRGVTTP